MRGFRPPKFNRQIVCITDRADLAATISSMVNAPREYLAVLRGPRTDRPDVDNEIARCSNAVAKVRAQWLVLAGLSPAAEALVVPIFPANRVIVVQSALEAVDRLTPHLDVKASDTLICNEADVGVALLRAKRQRRILMVRPDAPSLDITRIHRPADHAVVLDDPDSLAQTVAANYAHSVDADLILIPPRPDDLRDKVYRDLDEQQRHRSGPRGARATAALDELRVVLSSSLQFAGRSFITFVTRGLPYGYFCPDIPSTHMFSYPHLGELIIAGIFWANAEPRCLSAILVDSGHFAESETRAIDAMLMAGSVQTRLCVGAHATAEIVSLYIQAYPYDLMFICSHCSELPGKRLTMEIPDRTGVMRTIELEEVVQLSAMTISPEPERRVELHFLRRPITIDGLPWHEAPDHVKEHYEHIWNYLQVTPREHWTIRHEVAVDHVAHSTAIQLANGAVILSLIQVLDVGVSPMVFNNSCVSYYEAAGALTFAGARSYVGTLAPVDTRAAQSLAEMVFADPTTESSLPLALWENQRRVFQSPRDRTYVHVGCHFERVLPPRRDVSQLVRARLVDSLRRLAQPLQGDYSDKVEHFRRFLVMLLREQETSRSRRQPGAYYRTMN